MNVVHYHSLNFAQTLALGSAAPNELHLVHASGRGNQLECPANWVSLWLPLHGQIALSSKNNEWSLASRQIELCRETKLNGRSTMPSWWLCLLGPEALWRTGLFNMQDIYPWQRECPRDVRRIMIRLAQQSRHELCGSIIVDCLVDTLLCALHEHQCELRDLLHRCSGRTLKHRQQTLIRLLKVQQLIRSSLDKRFDLPLLADTANYSACHVLRLYREVFGETPFEYATKLRLERAWEIVRDTKTPVYEITQALGFENQSAFCRSFKQNFGLTTSEARQLGNRAIVH